MELMQSTGLKLFAILLFFTLTMTVLTYLPRVIEWEDQNGVFSTLDTQTVTVERYPTGNLVDTLSNHSSRIDINDYRPKR